MITPKEQAVYDASLVAAERLGREGASHANLIPFILDSPEVSAVLPKWGVGNLPPSFEGDVRRAFDSGRGPLLPPQSCGCGRELPCSTHRHVLQVTP